MTLQDLMMLYGVTLGKRRTAKQKYLFAQQLNELLLAGLTGGVRRGLDTAARILDVEIARAVKLETELVLAPAAEDEVGVSVDKAGGDEVTLRVDDLRALGGGQSAGADGGDDAVLNEDPGVL